MWWDVWWAVPAAAAAVGAGAAGWLGLRVRRRRLRAVPVRRVRRLEVDAARHDLRRARDGVPRAQAVVKAARAELAAATADRSAGRASAAEVAAARRGIAQAQREVTAAKAALVARRADLRVAYASVPTRADGPDAMPLARLTATHDAINAEWVAYETDPHKAVAYPSMTDVNEPLTVQFLRAQQQSQWLRPSTGARVAAADYAAYRESVRQMSRAFAAAEREAWRRAGDPRANEPAAHWRALATDVVGQALRSAEALARSATAAWPRGRNTPPAR